MPCYKIENGFMCGSFDEPHCFECAGFGDFLCDYPVGEGKTCDRPMCDKHRNNIAPEMDYCDHHFQEWEKFRASGGLTKTLKYQVVPFERKFIKRSETLKTKK